MRLLLFLFCAICLFKEHIAGGNEDFYELLGISRDANNQEIRKAFKKLAVKLHPDKNPEDKEAGDKFLKIARAYEILKSPETRKHYDLHGDTNEQRAQSKSYHSYSYYRDQFGIYDDDPHIITLTMADYEVNILDDNQSWFVNFYSSMCSHCHELAPTWKKLASDLQGVIRFAAVNCEDDWMLCNHLSIEEYPALLYYKQQHNIYEGERYHGKRTYEDLEEYILSRIDIQLKYIDLELWENEHLESENCLLYLCVESDKCIEEKTRIKVAAALEGLVKSGVVTDPALSEKLVGSTDSQIIIRLIGQKNDTGEAVTHKISGADNKEIIDSVLSLMPAPESVDEDSFKFIRTQLRIGVTDPWLFCFYLGLATELDLQIKRLPVLLPNYNIGLIHCGRSAALCSALHISRYPSWGVLKVGGAFELHYGRDVLNEITSFARDSIKATNLHALSPSDISRIKREGGPWFIDWFAPWCPPCRKLMPEVRRASQHFKPNQVQFGTVDCTLHRHLCAHEAITSYPTTFFINGSIKHYFHGQPKEEAIAEFVNDMLNPPVIDLDDSSFAKLIRKPKDELWVVDFYAPWCGPCQKLSPEWRKLAKQVKQFSEIKVAQVDCEVNSELCKAQNIKGYPTIRLYPLESKGLNTVVIYNGNRDMLSMKRWLLNFLPSPVEEFNAKQFRQQVLTKKYILPWLIDFYAPWCAHCVHFEPEFRTAAKRLEGKVRTAKVDCEAERKFCHELHVDSYPTVMLYISPTEKYVIDSQNVAFIVDKVKQLIASERTIGHDEL